MKAFRTEITPDPPGWSIAYADSIMLMGSCFAEHMGNNLLSRLFNVDLNPFGVLFNPVSIASGLQGLIGREKYTKDDLFFHQGLWHSFDHHSRFSGLDPEEVLEGINKRLLESSSNLLNAKTLFITFGTARVYHHLKNGRVVANCHKVPAAEFQNQLLRVGDVVRLYTRIFQELWQINSTLNIILTVSPVRHWKDGAMGNQVSKSTLILAVSELVNEFDQLKYFPAYEIFMDDLRDYRFYDQDMLHPGQAGIEYIWDKFSNCFFDSETRCIVSRVEKIVKARSHIPRNPDTEAYQEFQKNLDEKIHALKADHPSLNLFQSPIARP